MKGSVAVSAAFVFVAVAAGMGELDVVARGTAFLHICCSSMSTLVGVFLTLASLFRNLKASDVVPWLTM